MNMLNKGLVLGLAVTLLGGCQTLADIDKAAGEWAKKRNAERAARAQQRRDSRWLTSTPSKCTTVRENLYTSVGVDTAYVRLKRHFSFLTLAEKEKSVPYPEWISSTGFKHEALPGVRYSMTDEIPYKNHYVWLSMVIEREGSKTFVGWDYCSKTEGWEKQGDPEKVRKSLAAEIKRTVGG